MTQVEAEVDGIIKSYQEAKAQLRRIIAGQDTFVDQLMVCLFSGGHALIEGVPGLAKTLTIRTLASLLDLSFSRIQFTPDLMPGDITGTTVLQDDGKRRTFEFSPGPVFASLVLADEINRAAPKTQSALLECMQEHRVTVSGETHPLPEPFFVLATQNPIEHEGTYPLPEAQLDRFMFMIKVGYPDKAEEAEIVSLSLKPPAPVEKVLTRGQLLRVRELALQVPVAEHVMSYIVDLVRSTRPGKDSSAFTNKYVQWGGSPRAAIYLTQAAQVNALLQRRFNVSKDDVTALALPVLRHRIIPTYEAEAEEMTVDVIIGRILSAG